MNAVSWKSLSRVAVLVATSLVLSACLMDGDGATASAGSGGAVEGGAFLGPVIGGSASLYKVKLDGSNETPAVETVSTDATGFKFTKTVDGVARVCITGGAYTDESTGGTVTNNLTICSIFNAAKTGSKVYVTPVTTFVDELVKGKIKKLRANNSAELDTYVSDADLTIRGVFNITAPVSTVKPTLTKPDAGKENSDEYKAGLLLGAYSQLVKNYVTKCGGDAQQILNGLFKDIQDGKFDGKSLDDAGAQIAATHTCNGTATTVSLGAGTADLTKAIDDFKNTDTGKGMDADKNTGTTDGIKNTLVTGTAAPDQVKSLPSQGLIAIDTKNNVGYVPIYTKDGSGNGMIAIVNLTVGASSPVIKTVTLAGSVNTFASNYNLADGMAYVAAADNSGNVYVYVVNSTDYSVSAKITATGVSWNGSYGGVIVDSARQRVLIAGSNSLGILDISGVAPQWMSGSAINTAGTDSITFNSDTGVMFISSDGGQTVVNTLGTPTMTIRSFSNSSGLSFGTTDGVAFDVLTGLMIIDPEFQDKTYVINMAEMPLTGTASAPAVGVNGLGTSGTVGEGPGGQAAVNVLTHQGVIADEFGENLKLIQLPTTSVAGAPTLSQAYTIATTVIPNGTVNNVATPLGIRGDPNSLSVDPVRNFAYMLADTQRSYHPITGSTQPLFLVRVDLSAPVQGACPSISCTLKWTPVSAAIRMP